MQSINHLDISFVAAKENEMNEHRKIFSCNDNLQCDDDHLGIAKEKKIRIQNRSSTHSQFFSFLDFSFYFFRNSQNIYFYLYMLTFTNTIRD